MRKKKEPQLNLLNLMPRNKIAQELEAIAHLLDMGQYPSDSTLQKNITAIDAETWEAVNRALLRFAAQQDIEKGRTGLWGMPFRPSPSSRGL